MFKAEKVNNETLSEIYNELSKIYTLTEIGQEALDACTEYSKDGLHITCLIDIILDKFKTVLYDLKNIIK